MSPGSLDGGPGADPQTTGEILSHNWLGSNWGCARRRRFGWTVLPSLLSLQPYLHEGCTVMVRILCFLLNAPVVWENTLHSNHQNMINTCNIWNYSRTPEILYMVVFLHPIAHDTWHKYLWKEHVWMESHIETVPGIIWIVLYSH